MLSNLNSNSVPVRTAVVVTQKSCADAVVPMRLFWQACNPTILEVFFVLAGMHRREYVYWLGIPWEQLPENIRVRLLRVLCEAAGEAGG